ncbi:MAG TPA: LysR family transcriptional regulator [Chloroflexota bacterium]|jgi:DNA-binding transcriptional LysR family regulator
MLNAPASLYHLRTFHAVATERSFTRAAEQMDLSQPAVSGHIRALERHYGTPLFIVRHRRVYLTAEGAALYEYTERVFNLLRDAERAVAATQGLERGQLALGASTTIGNYLLPPVLGAYVQAHPGVRVEVSIGTSAELIADVLADRLPFGLIEAPVSHPELDVRPFATDELVLIVPPEHPWAAEKALPLDALRDAPFLRREAGAGIRELVDGLLERAGVTVESVMELGSTEALKQAVLADVGVAWVPRITVLRELALGLLVAVPVPAVDLRRALSVVVPQRARLAPAAEELLRLLQVANPLGPLSPNGAASAPRRRGGRRRTAVAAAG